MAHHYQSTEVRKRQIAEAALAVIAETGLAGFTTRAIAARIEITDGTIFRHFANKQEIVIAAMRRLEEELFSDAMEGFEDPLQRLEALFKSRAELLGGSQAIGRLVFSDALLHAGGDESHAIWSNWRERSLTFINTTLSALRAQGRLRDDLTISGLARVLLGTLLTFANERAAERGPIPQLQAQIDEAWTTLETLLMKPKEDLDL